VCHIELELHNGKLMLCVTHGQICGFIKSQSGNKPGEVICKVAEHDTATMIVVGQRGISSVRRTIMGSVSDYVVHHAHCPVVICRNAAN